MTNTPNNFRIELTKDKFQALLSIVGNSFPAVGEVKQELSRQHISVGINDEAIRAIINQRQQVSNRVIAEGKLAVKGKDAVLIWYVDLESAQKPTITDTGHADFKLLHFFEQVYVNQELLSKVPADRGQPGQTVTGEKYFLYGDDIALPLGKNIELSEDGLTLKATKNGYAIWQDNQLNVDDLLHIKGSINYKTGNIKFNGSILIDGDVQSGFRVEATENIEIKGNVDAAEVYSHKGNIIIDRGINGKNRARILAGKSIYTGYVQDANLSAKEDIEIYHYAFNAEINSGGSVKLSQNEGLIRGGRVIAEENLHAKVVGSEMGAPTYIGIGSGGNQDLQRKRWDILAKRDKVSRKLISSRKKIDFILLLKDRVGELSEEKIRELEKLNENIDYYNDEIEQISDDENQILDKIAETSGVNNIKILDQLNRKVTIAIGTQEYYTEKSFHAVQVFKKGDEIMFKDLDGDGGKL